MLSHVCVPQALQGLHGAGIAHLDFKALNCLFSFPAATAPPVVRLIDLGFAAGFTAGVPPAEAGALPADKKSSCQ